MGETRRQQRVEKELRQIIGRLLISGLKDPVPGFVSVSRVEVSKDLRHSKVFVSEMTDEADPDEVVSILQNQAGLIQKNIAHELPMKFCPKVKFYWDHGYHKGLKVERMIHELSQEESD